jgi:hypothetical protein
MKFLYFYSPNKLNLSMKKLITNFITVVVVIVAASVLTSCSKSSFGGKKYDSVSVSPVAPKFAPVRKKYIINNKRRPILGLERR